MFLLWLRQLMSWSGAVVMTLLCWRASQIHAKYTQARARPARARARANERCWLLERPVARAVARAVARRQKKEQARGLLHT